MGIECPPNIKDVAHNLELRGGLGREERRARTAAAALAGTRALLSHKSAPGVRGRPGRERTFELLGGYATFGRALSEKSASTRHTAMQP